MKGEKKMCKIEKYYFKDENMYYGEEDSLLTADLFTDKYLTYIESLSGPNELDHIMFDKIKTALLNSRRKMLDNNKNLLTDFYGAVMSYVYIDVEQSPVDANTIAYCIDMFSVHADYKTFDKFFSDNIQDMAWNFERSSTYNNDIRIPAYIPEDFILRNVVRDNQNYELLYKYAKTEELKEYFRREY